ncbi:MAG: DUF4388 domain-containing protein [Candidatus Eisenbacteria bacterium]|nr:DUF4388 domain-containing protein [Candidatus Eisenbacteria bacterium]
MLTLSGTLDPFLPIQILRLLQSARATGRLEFTRGDECAEVFVLDGLSAFTRTSALHQRLGDVLAEAGLVHPEATEFAAAWQQDVPGKRLGQVLVESGALTPEQLDWAVLEVQRRILRDLLLWQDGAFAFHRGECAVDEDITLDLDLDRLLTEALRSREAAELATRTDRAA